MKTKFLFLIAPLFVVTVGCSSETAPSTEQDKKNFMGGPMPKDFMKEHGGPAVSGQKAGEDLAAKAAAAAAAAHSGSN